LEVRPLSELGWPELEKYAHKALTTMGTLDDFKRFLPRLLELVAHATKKPHLILPCDPQIILGKISYAQNRPDVPQSQQGFTSKELKAIEVFLTAWWRRELARMPEPDEYDRADVLEAIGCATHDVAPYLDIWSSANGLSASAHLAKLVNACAAEIYNARNIELAFWSRDLSTCELQLTSWLRSPVPRQILESSILGGQAGRWEQELSNALSVLEHLAAAKR
jgi:hypothetical protein